MRRGVVPSLGAALPSSPSWLLPQHSTWPPGARMAQLKPSPEVIATACDPMGTVVGETGQALPGLAMFTSPGIAFPQHSRAPVLKSTQKCSSPAAISMTPVPRPGTGMAGAPAATPSQHATPPPLLKRHIQCSPALMQRVPDVFAMAKAAPA
jgi:hypothetical protein